MVQWNDAVEEIPNSIATADSWLDDSFSDNFSEASQSMDELLNGNDTLGQDDTFFESLDELALDEMAQEFGSDKVFLDNMEDIPKLDSSVTGSMAAGAGLFSGAVFVEAQVFVVRKIISLRNMSENDDLVLDELVDVDDVKNAATSLGDNAYRASAESTRNRFGASNFPSGTPPVGVESAA
jgi:hypothetical protein